ncbi:MAG: hypothetical protein J7639_27945, partial [Paenibacillaceae bacterium]|nr:hypothetical protein [Paenibacillaceae bacterium]
AYTSGADITGADLRAKPYVGVYTVDALGKVLRFTPVTIDESMLQAGLFVTRTDGTALTLNGSQLDGSIVRMNIIGNTYKWKTNIAAGDFVLNGAPGDMAIAGVYRISDKVLDVKLAYAGSAITGTLNSMTITANASAFGAGGGSLTSDTIPIAPPAPATPWQSSLSAVGGDGQATVTFSAPIGADSVTLEYADNPNFYGRHKLAVNPADTHVDASGLTNGQTYWFRLVIAGGTQPGTSNVEQVDIGESAPAAAGVPVIYTYEPLEGQEGTIAPGQSFKLQFNSLLDNRNGQAAEAIRQGLGSDFAGRIAVEDGTDSGWSSQFTGIALDTISLTEGDHRIALAPGSVTNRSGRTNDDYIAFDIVGDWSEVRPVLDFGKIGFDRDDYYGTPRIYGQEGAVNQSGATIMLYEWDGTLDGEAIDSDYSHLQAVGSGSSNEDGSFRFNIGSHDTSKQLVVLAQGRGGNYSSGTYDSGMITGIQPAATKLVNKATPFLTGAPELQHVQQYASFTLDVANYFADDDVLGYTFAGGYSTSVINSAYFIDNGKLSLLGGQSGTTAIIVTATDMFGAQASQTFNISVEESAPTALAASQVHYYPAAGTGDTIVISGLSSFWNKTIRVYDAAEGGRILGGEKLMGGEQAFDGTITYQLHEDLGAAGKDLWVTLTDYGWAESERVKIGKQDRTHELAFVNSFNQAAGFKLNPIATGTLRYVVLDSVDPVPSPTQIASGTDSEWESVDVSGSFNVTAGVDNEFYLLGLDQYAIKRIYAVITDDVGNIFPVLTSFFNVHEAGSVSAGWPDAYEVHSANEALFPYLMPGDLKLKKGDTLLLHFDRPVDSDTTAQKIASALEDMGWNGHYTVEALPVIPSSLAHTFRVHITGAITPMLPVSIELQGVQGFGDEYASEYISFMGITDYPEPELVADSTYNDAFHPITLTLPNIGVRLDQLSDPIQISFEPPMSTNSFPEGGEEEGGEEEGDDGLQFVAYDHTIAILPGQLPSGEWLIHVTVPGYQTATVEQAIVDSYNVIPEGGDFYIATLFDVEDLQKLQLNGGDVTNDQYRLNSSFDPYSELEYYEVWLKHDYLATLPTGFYTVAVDIGGYEDSYPLSIFNPLVRIAQARGNATLAAEVTLQDLLDAGATAVAATRLDAYQAAIGLASAAETFDLSSLQTLITDVNTSLTLPETPSPRISSAVLSGWQVAMLTSESVAAPNPATVGPDSFTLIARDEAGNRITTAATDVHIESVRVESGSIVVRLAGALGATDTVELRPNAEASNYFQNAGHVALTGTSGPLHLLPNVAPVVRELAIGEFGPVLEAQFYVEDDDGDVEGTHKIQWYRSNEADGSLTPIAGANGTEYHPTAADLGKYIRVLVTPVSLTGVTTGVPVLSEAIQQSVLYSDVELSINGLPEMEEMSGIPIPVYASVQPNFTFRGHVSGADAGEIAVVKLTIRERYGPYLRQTGEGEYSWVSGSDPLNEFEVPVDESGNWTWTLPNAALQRPDEYTRFIVTATATAGGKLAQSGQGYFDVDYREPQLESANVYGNTIVLRYNQKLDATSLGTFEPFHFVIGNVDGIGSRTAHVIAASFEDNYLTLKFDTVAAVGETIEGGYAAPVEGMLRNWAGVPLGSFYQSGITNATADDFTSASMPAADHNKGYLPESGEDVAVFRLTEGVSAGMTLDVQLPAEHAGNQTWLSPSLDRNDFELRNAQGGIVAWAENPGNFATENEFGIRVLHFPLGGPLAANETYTLRYVGESGLVRLPNPALRADASLAIVDSYGFASLKHVFGGLSYGYPDHGPQGITFTDLDTDAGQVKGTVAFTPAVPSDESDIVDYAFYWLDQNGRIIDNGFGGEIASLSKDGETSFEFHPNYPMPAGTVSLAVYARNEYGRSRQFAATSGFDNVSGDNESPHAVGTMPDLHFESSSVTSSTIYVGNYFADVDDDYLIYSVSSSDDAVVAFGTWAVSGSSITMTIAGSGTATVTITADDGHGHQLPRQFQVTVNAPEIVEATTNRIGNVVRLVFNRPIASLDAEKFHVYLGTENVDIDWSRSGVDSSDATGQAIVLALDGYVAAGNTVTIDLDDGAITAANGVLSLESIGYPVENQAAAPANAPWLVHFTDENKYAGSIQGSVSIGRAQDESDIEGYRLYWAKSDLTQVGATIATLPKSADPLVYLFDGVTTIPAQAARLVAVAINEQGESAPAYVELVDAADMSFSGVSTSATSLGFTMPAASAGTAHVAVTDSDAWPWGLADILSGSHGGKQAIYTAVQPELQAGDSIVVSLNDLTPDTIYTVYVVIQAEDGSYSSIATSSFPLPPPAISGTLQMIDAGGAANDGKTEIVLSAPASGHSYRYKRWSGVSLKPHVGDLLAGADGWISVQSGDLLEASNHELFAVAEVDGNGQMVGLSFVSAVVAKEPPALTADATNNNVDQPIELSFPDNADWRANVTSVTVKRHSDQAVVNAVYSVLEGKVVLAKGAFAVSGEYVDYDITVLANGYSPTQASQRVLGRSTSPTVYMVSAVNAFTGEDIVNVFEVPAYAEVRVYDAADADTPIATKTQGSTGGVPVVLAFPGGFASGLHVVYISLTNHANGLAESERMAYRLPLPVLVPPVSFTDAPGAASDGKTKAAIGSPSVAGHTFRYWKVTGAEIPFPVSGDKATGWSAIVNGQELDAANGQNIIVVEVDDEDTIIAYSVSQAVVKEALASPNDTQITVENSLAAGAVDYVKVVNVPANTTVNVYSEGSGDTKLGSAANVQTYAADVRVLINVGFEPLRTSFYVGYSRNGMEDSERTLRYVPTPQLSLTLADVEGAANDGTTKATVAGTGASGHKFYYKLSASALSGIGISSHIAAPEWQLLGGDGYIADATGQYVTVAETDADGNVVALAGQMAVVANALQAPAAGGITVVNNAVGEDTVIVANVPAGATVFVNDSGGARIGEAVNTDETPATMSVAIEFGFAPLLAEVRVGFTQEGMEDSLLTSVALPLPSLMEEPGFTYVRGSDYVVKSTIALGVLSEEGHQYRYVLSPDYSPVTPPVIGQSLDSWTEIADGETITANSGQGIGVAEVDGAGRAIRFSAGRVNATRNLGLELEAGITHKLNAIGGFQTFVDREALPAGAQGFSKIEVQTWQMDPVVSNGIAIYSADVYNDQDGFGNAVPYQGMWKTLVILFDAGNHPLGYYIGQADTTARPQELAAPPDFTFVSRSGNQVVSALKLDELETEGHSYKYKLAANYYSMIIPQDFDTTDDWLAVPADGLITANSGQGVGIAEVDADGLVVKFSAVQAGWASDLGVPLEAGAITRKFTPYGFRTFVDRSLLPDEVKGFSRIEVQMWSVPPVVSNGKTIYTVDEYNDQYGYSSGLSNLGVWYPLVVLFDADNHPLGYYFDQVDIADRSPELAAPPDFTYVGSAGSQAISTVALANPGTGHSYKYKLFPDYNSVYVPQAGDATNDWLPVPENGRITANSGQDIGFAEVDADGRVVKFSAARFNTTRQLGVPITTGIVQKLTASGGYRTHITRADLPVEAQGFSKIEVLSWLSPPDVSNGVTIFYTNDYNEQYGYSTGLPFQGMWYPLVILFDASNHPVGYFIGSIETTLPPALTVVPSAIDAEGSGNDGKTRIVLGAPSSGNAYRYMLANTGDTVDYPHAGDDATAWNELTLESWQDGLASGVIAAAHGRQIGIAEVDGQGKVLRFGTVQAVTMDATPAPLANAITLTNAAAGTDTVTVANVPAGAFVYVYDAAGSELGKAQNGSGAFGSVTVAIQGGLSPLLGKIYVELTQTGKEPSGRTEKIVLAPLPAGVAQLSGSYEDSAKTVITLGAPSAVGNKYRYTLYSGTDDVHIPQAGASLSTMAGIWQTALDGQAIAAEANQLIGIAEVDTSGRIVAFQVAAAVHFQAAPSLQADTTDAFSDVPIEITSASGDPAAPGWWAAASSGAVVTHTVGGVTYELSANQYG